MHIYVIERLVKGKTVWRLIWQQYVNGKAKQKRVPLDQYLALGFPLELTKEEAQARATQVNAQESLKVKNAVMAGVTIRLQNEELAADAFLIQADVAEFEQKTLFARKGDDKAKKYKIGVHWRAAKRAMLALKIDISDWEHNFTLFYDYFKTQQYSPSYCDKLLRILNQWGRFQARKYRKPFDKLPNPKGKELHDIADTYFEKTGRKKESAPLSPSQLEKQRGNLDSTQFNWLYISVWFGLRPAEVDMLLEPSSESTWYLEKDEKGTHILWIYQTKLKSVSRDKRLKGIPCDTKEQGIALELIASGQLKRPLNKTIKKLFGEKTTCYAGRKGFTDLMLDLGYGLEDIAAWMGHSTIDRTWRNYKNKKTVRYKKVS